MQMQQLLKQRYRQFLDKSIKNTSVKYNASLKELWNVEENAEENDWHDIEKNSLGDADGLGEVSVGVGMADGAIPSNKQKFISLEAG